ncbi:MAG: hypothetical protein R3E39_09870 [Anaerolineae bacterium]
MYGNLALDQFSHALSQSHNGRTSQAVELFTRQLPGGPLNGLHKLLGRTRRQLHHLAQCEQHSQLNNRRYMGIQSLAVTNIHGTFDRAADFDYDFRSLKQADQDRWCRVASAMLDGVGLPPIEVVQVGEDYFVKDGHHRVSVARALGLRFLDAVVEVWGE